MAIKKENKVHYNLTNEEKWYKIANAKAVKYNLDIEKVLEIFSFETTKAINDKIDRDAKILFTLDKENHLVYVKNINGVVEENDPDVESSDLKNTYISLEQAQKIDKNAKIGDPFEIDFDFDLVPRSTKIAINNGFMQNFRATEKEMIYEKYESLIGKKIRAEVLSSNKDGSYNVKFEDGTTAFLPKNKINKNAKLNLGSHLDVYLEKINISNKLSICEVSIDSPNMVRDIIKTEIPEINQGLLEIVKIERSPGIRTKIVLKTLNSAESFDPFGSVFGEGARRILSISEKLNNEKIDVIKYSEDIKEYIKNALSPARVLDVVGDDPKKGYIVIVDVNEMKNAIGKRGINIELANKIIGVKLQILSDEEAIERNIDFTRTKYEERHLIGHKKRKFTSRDNQRNEYFKGIEIDMNEFSMDVAQFNESLLTENKNKSTIQTKKIAKKPEKIEESELDDLFNKESFLNYLDDGDDFDFVEKINLAENDEEFEEKISLDEKDSSEKIKPIVKAYKEAKVEIKDFKVDNDLANYGLNLNLDSVDLSGFDDEWDSNKK
ncbi:NusA N-terminal domain-containing protein [Mycoplasmopsis cricetuli]|uniref:NusA N-terminal domain-containing protein n=1 Tax=Mycoplasmopsis cricetuli TaxID=171283 RepID=UPI0004713CC1|nr:NusA N-terminal domain-containing protein [Mycoplasmopsis cricetuli]